MKAAPLPLLLALPVVCLLAVAQARAATIHANSPDFADVKAAVFTASHGDTVIVPIGMARWNATLTITKNITLAGAGIGWTVIVSDINDIRKELVAYAPDAVSRATNGLFRITGFTFDGNGRTSRGVYVGNWTTELIDRVHIDRNRFVDCKYQGVKIEGFVHGLVDHNEFFNCYKGCDVYGKYWDSWELIPLVPGSKHSFYIEDNLFVDCNGITSCGHGGRYVFRYNRVDNPQSYDVLDMHGNQAPVTDPNRNDSRGTVTAEIYRNEVVNFGKNSNAGRFLCCRGGTAIVFGNRISGTEQSCVINLREEDGPQRFNFLTKWPGYDPVKDTFIWDNEYNGKEIVPTLIEPALDGIFIRPDREYWHLTPAFNGTTGMGAGPAAGIPRSGQPGVGYWAVDRQTLFRYVEEGPGVAVAPRRPEDVLPLRPVCPWRWRAFYTPYTYPHPLAEPSGSPGDRHR